MRPRNVIREAFDAARLSRHLGKTTGKAYWRSLEELARTPEFEAHLVNEFRLPLPDSSEVVNRRRMLQLLGASMGLAGLTACTKQPPEKIVPYVRAPEEIVPGKPLFYATAFVLGGMATGVLVESHMGRPIKVEGNPQHPASLGGADALAQASILTLYDPDRSKVVVRNGRISSWVNFLAAVNSERESLVSRNGRGLSILTETVTSPTLASQLQAVLAQFPEARWHQYEPVNRDWVREGARLAFGEPLNTVYRFAQADVVLSLDADFMAAIPGAMRYARDFAARRRPDGPMNRLYMAEPGLSVTGAAADHRLALPRHRVEALAWALAEAIGVPVQADLAGLPEQWVKAAAADLTRSRGRCLILAGDQQPPSVHAIAHLMNHALGNVGTTVYYTSPVEANPEEQTTSVRELVQAMNAGEVEILLVLSGNPVFDTPADLDFRSGLLKVPQRMHLGLYADETAELCHWHLPEAHTYESWGDARAYDGTVTILQPLIAPLYNGRSALEVLAAFLGQPSRSGHEIVRERWQNELGSDGFEKLWRVALHDGVVAESALPAVQTSPKADSARTLPSPPQGGEFEIVLRPDPTIWDGRFANNGWLQELPKPLTKLTWDNAALVSPATAGKLALASGDVIDINYEGRAMKAPIWVSPGHADGSITVHLGYGRTRGGGLADGAGFNAYVVRTSTQPWSSTNVTVTPAREKYALVCTQDHHSMEGRNLVRVATLEEYEKDHHFAHHGAHEPGPEMTLYPGFEYTGYSWGMAIDLNACIGCGACVVACQAENNIAVVGKTEVARGREMHWIRVDRYFEGELDDPEVCHQPVPCMHCENAPCEVVCPTAATVHSEEGLNQMAYNRCVGTRYCSNNCPYKVRRFNFYRYSDWETPSLKLLRNPDVTVRSRGVMEKCTYCVQRINAARITAEKENRKISDGEVVTACQGACPTQAIVFGDINDPNSRVAQLKNDPRNYGILSELNTRPRTTYLARLRNPNPELERS